MNLRDYLKENRIITDGAMGTYYDQVSGKCNLTEEANLTEPEVIYKIHRAYIEAGARLIRTNTFAVNSVYFEDEKQIGEIIGSAFHIARRAIEDCRREGILGKEEQIFLAADMGPIAEASLLNGQTMAEQYKMLVDCFQKGNPDVMLFETLSEWGFLREVAEYIRQKSDVCIMAQFCFDRSGYTKAGLGINSFLKEVGSIPELDIYGFNCGMSSAHMYHFIKDAAFATDKQVSALPNASYPNVVRGRVIYSGQKNYFVEQMEAIDALGVRVLGGCCGTTPDYIRQLAKSLKDKPLNGKREEKIQPGEDAGESSSRNYIEGCLGKKKKVIMVELDPPFDGDPAKVLEGAEFLKGKGTDIITLSDSPLARARMDAGLLGAKVYGETKMRVMPHIACRDRNKIAMRGLIMGMHANGIRNLLLVTGDPVINGDDVKSVYEFNSIKLMEFVRNINEEMFPDDPMYYGGALNYHGVNAQAIVTRMQKKMEAGASYFLTQPVYSPEDIERLAWLKEQTRASLIVGIMPLVSRKNALFIQNEMPGINIPQETIDRYKEGLDRESYEQIAVETSLQLIAQMGDIADGYFFMTPFNRYGLIQKIIERIGC